MIGNCDATAGRDPIGNGDFHEHLAELRIAPEKRKTGAVGRPGHTVITTRWAGIEAPQHLPRCAAHHDGSARRHAAGRLEQGFHCGDLRAVGRQVKGLVFMNRCTRAIGLRGGRGGHGERGGKQYRVEHGARRAC